MCSRCTLKIKQIGRGIGCVRETEETKITPEILVCIVRRKKLPFTSRGKRLRISEYLRGCLQPGSGWRAENLLATLGSRSLSGIQVEVLIATWIVVANLRREDCESWTRIGSLCRRKVSRDVPWGTPAGQGAWTGWLRHCERGPRIQVRFSDPIEFWAKMML